MAPYMIHMVHCSDLDAEGEAAFQRDLVALIPYMRAFARSLSGDAAQADDLAQDAMMKAWRNRSGFETGSIMKAWVFMILRNQFYSERRRSWRSTQLDPEVAERSLVANDDPMATLELNELRQALKQLPAAHRDTIILVGAGGLAYDEAAAICGCPVGTIKSRVSRGRVALQALLASGAFAQGWRSGWGGDRRASRRPGAPASLKGTRPRVLAKPVRITQARR